MDHKIMLAPGDGIGPEVIDAAVLVLEAATAGSGRCVSSAS